MVPRHPNWNTAIVMPREVPRESRKPVVATIGTRTERKSSMSNTTASPAMGAMYVIRAELRHASTSIPIAVSPVTVRSQRQLTLPHRGEHSDPFTMALGELLHAAKCLIDVVGVSARYGVDIHAGLAVTHSEKIRETVAWTVNSFGELNAVPDRRAYRFGSALVWLYGRQVQLWILTASTTSWAFSVCMVACQDSKRP